MDLLLTGSLEPEEWSDWLAVLAQALPGHRVWRGDRPFDPAAIEVALVAHPAPGSLRALPRLRLIQSLWAGVDRLLGDATLPPGIPLARMVDPGMSAAMAETALWATLGAQRDFFTYARQQQRAQWQPWGQRTSAQWPVTVLGRGEIGGTVAARLAAAGHPVRTWGRTPAPSSAPAPGPGVITALHGEAALHAALADTAVLMNLLPLTDATRDLLGTPLLRHLPAHATLVHLGRGAQLVEADLLDALDRGALRHAVLDVFRTEPLPPTHAFWHHPAITVLPHVAAQTMPATAVSVVVANVNALADGAPLRHEVQRTRGY